MRSISFRFSLSILATSVSILGCSDPAGNSAINQGGSSSGSNSIGGAVGTGGSTTSASVKSTGGRTGSTTKSDSVKSTGGRTGGNASSGGSTDSGETGGSTSTDGTFATGGATRAGSSSVVTGGTTATGSTKSSSGKGGAGGTESTGSGLVKGGTTATGGTTSVDTGTGNGSDEACNAGKWSTTDVTVKGPFETVSENVDGAILYRPKEMIAGCLYPVITWGHGAGGNPSNYTTALTLMASHGFVVIASTAGNVQDGGSSANQFNNQMVQVADWVIKQNANSSSVLYQKIDTTKIGAAGHSQGGYGASEAGQNPLIETSVSISGAVGSSNQKGPAFIICGGKDTYSGARCEDHPTASFNGTSGVPVFFGKCLSADHGNWGFEGMLADKTKPHDVVQATMAWFRYHLMGDEVYRSWFYGADCQLCKHSNWSVQRKGME